MGDPRYNPHRGRFNKLIGQEINKYYSNLEERSVRAIYALIDVYVPYVEGICLKCFKVRFPDKGLGILYQKKDSLHNKIEVKLSPAKPDGHPSQREIYITNTIQVYGKSFYVNWTLWKSSEPIFSSARCDPRAHIPWIHHKQNSINNWLIEEKQQKQLKEFIGTTKEVRISSCHCR